jgi:hypothetical protein
VQEGHRGRLSRVIDRSVGLARARPMRFCHQIAKVIIVDRNIKGDIGIAPDEERSEYGSG